MVSSGAQRGLIPCWNQRNGRTFYKCCAFLLDSTHRILPTLAIGLQALPTHATKVDIGSVQAFQSRNRATGSSDRLYYSTTGGGMLVFARGSFLGFLWSRNDGSFGYPFSSRGFYCRARGYAQQLHRTYLSQQYHG